IPGARRRSPARSIMYGTPIAITSSASTEAGFSCSPPTDANDRSAKMSSVGRAITTSTTPASSRIANSSGMASARPPATSRSPRPLAIATRYTAIAIATAVSQTSGPPEACTVAPLHGAGAGTGCGRDPVRAGEANVLRRGAGLRALVYAAAPEDGVTAPGQEAAALEADANLAGNRGVLEHLKAALEFRPRALSAPQHENGDVGGGSSNQGLRVLEHPRGGDHRHVADASIGERGTQARHRSQRARLGLDRRTGFIALPRPGHALVGEQGGGAPGGGERRRQFAAERCLADGRRHGDDAPGRVQAADLGHRSQRLDRLGIAAVDLQSAQSCKPEVGDVADAGVELPERERDQDPQDQSSHGAAGHDRTRRDRS